MDQRLQVSYINDAEAAIYIRNMQNTNFLYYNPTKAMSDEDYWSIILLSKSVNLVKIV